MHRYRTLEGWALTAMYPLAAVLVVVSLQSLTMHDFRKDWPFAFGGPVGAAVWWLVFAANKSTVGGLVAGYVAGAFCCAITVIAVEAILAKR